MKLAFIIHRTLFRILLFVVPDKGYNRCLGEASLPFWISLRSIILVRKSYLIYPLFVLDGRFKKRRHHEWSTT